MNAVSPAANSNGCPNSASIGPVSAAVAVGPSDRVSVDTASVTIVSDEVAVASVAIVAGVLEGVCDTCLRLTCPRVYCGASRQ